jgi:hypothetical protein
MLEIEEKRAEFLSIIAESQHGKKEAIRKIAMVSAALASCK